MTKTTKKAETAAKTTETVKTPVAEAVKAPVAAKETKPAAKKETKTKKAAAKKPAAKKAATKKTAEKKTAEKKTAAAKAPKAAAKAAAVKVVLEYKGLQVSQDDIVAAVKADWKGAAIKTLEIYVKPEDAAAYYVVNGNEGGKVTL